MSAEASVRTPAEVATSVLAAFASRDSEVLAHTHPDCVDDFVGLGEFRGHDAIRGIYEEMFAAFPDFDIQPTQIVGDDHRAAAAWVATGTFSGGPFQGVQPTGRKLELRGLDLMEIEDGLVRHNTIYYDGASFARSIGMLPQQNSLGERAVLGAFNTRTRVGSFFRRR